MEKNINELARNISKLTTEELDMLSNVLTNKYGIFSNIYPYPAGIISISSENITYDVYINNAGNRKLSLVKGIKEILDIGLKEAKDILDSIPCTFIINISIEEAEKIKFKLENKGATVEII